MAASWWHEPFRMLQTNLREIDAGLDVERVLDYLRDFGVDTWLLSVGGILSNYPTELDFQTPNPRLSLRPSGDLVGDAVAAARRRGIRVLGRMDFSKIDHARSERHPEWCFVDAAGERQVYNGLTSVCPSGDYYQERLFEVLSEVLGRYQIDGFFCNWMSYNEIDYSKQYRGVCQCLACVRRFAEYAPGMPMPTGPESPTYQTWKRFSRDTLDRLTARIREHIAGLRPGTPLILGDRADIVFHEANNAVGRPLWHHRTSENVSAAKTYRPGVPVLTNSVGFVDMPYRAAGEEPHHFAQYLVQAIARGANPSTYIMGTPDDNPYACLEVAGRITRFHRDHVETYRNLRPDARTLLVRPDPLKSAGARLAEATAEFQGLYLSLQERHIPFDVVPEDRLAAMGASTSRSDDHRQAADLARYRLVVLPDLGPLPAGAVTALDAYVEAGGALLATGSSGLDADAAQLACLPVARRLASLDTVESTRSLHLRVDAGESPEPLIPVVGAFHVVQPRSDAESGLRALSRAPYGPPEKCHGHVPLEHPGRLAARHGKGTAAILPWTVGRGYREVGLSAYRDVFVDAVLAVGGADLAVDTGLPEQVEVVLGRSAAGRVVHLLNRSGDAPQRFRAPLTIPESEIVLPWSANVRSVEALNAGRTLSLTRDGDRIRVQLPPIGLFEVLVAAG